MFMSMSMTRWFGRLAARGSRFRPIRHVRSLFAEGSVLYCWSAGGGEYAKQTAEELGIGDCFVAFLPKPNVVRAISSANITGGGTELIEIRKRRCDISTWLQGQGQRSTKGIEVF